MKRDFPYLYFFTVGIATVLNILNIASILNRTWVTVGVFVVLLGNVLDRNIYDKQESPLYLKNFKRDFKKKPTTSVFVVLFALALVVTLFITVI